MQKSFYLQRLIGLLFRYRWER